MVHFELYDLNDRLTQKPYEFTSELKFMIFKIVTEMREVIETFSTKEFLNIPSEGADQKKTGLE
jgi:hypothetical protein